MNKNHPLSLLLVAFALIPMQIKLLSRQNNKQSQNQLKQPIIIGKALQKKLQLLIVTK